MHGGVEGRYCKDCFWERQSKHGKQIYNKGKRYGCFKIKRERLSLTSDSLRQRGLRK
jgi:hypothetical protein